MKKTRGFTLIELLVVIAIIGILSSIVLASLNSARQSSRDARRISDLKQVQLALELYFDGNSAYPIAITWAALDALNAIEPTFMPVLPADPSTNEYGYLGSATTYCLSMTTEGTAPAGASACTPEVTDPVANYQISP